jgi:sugar/nucleoside kinase (ribokinase family)
MSAVNREPSAGDAHARPLICTIGDLILDVVVLPKAPLAPDGDTPATIRLTAGGQAANVAAWASALGGRSRLICVRGTDEASEIAAAHLQQHGVELCGPVIEGTGGVVVSTRGIDGARTMVSDPGVTARLTAADLDEAWVRGADVLHVSGYCLLRDSVAEAAIAAARLASRVTLDLASANDIELFGPERFLERVRELAPDLIFANEAERAVMPELGARIDAGGPDADGSDRPDADRPDIAWVIKLGARGAIFPEGRFDSAPASVVDTTGAGDALAAGYLLGGPQLAIDAAARCVERIGAMPPLAEAAG